MANSILLVEDEIITALSLRDDLVRFGYDVSEPVSTGEEAVRICLADRPAIILIDINIIGEMDGIDTVQKIHETADIPVIYITGYSNKEIKERAMKTKPLGYLEKPVNSKEIKHLLETCSGLF